MARTYWPRNSVSMPEGRTLDGARCTELIQQATAVEEEARFHLPTILPAYEVAEPYRIGMVPVRFDRDGMVRELSVAPLCCGGASQVGLYAFLVDSWLEPDDALDDYAYFSVGGGTTPYWVAAETITPARERLFPGRRFADGDELVRARFAFLIWMWNPAHLIHNPRLAGWRVEELVAT